MGLISASATGDAAGVSVQTVGSERRAKSVKRRGQSGRWFLLILAALTPLVLAFEGGAYDIVVRQEFGLVIWAGIALLAMFGYLPTARPSRSARTALLALAGMTAWASLALLWTESLERTTAEIARTVSFAGIATLAYLGLGRARWRSAADGLLIALLLLPGLALAGRLFPELPWSDTPGFVEGRRLLGPLEYWNATAAWGVVSVGAGLILSADRRRSAIRALALSAVVVAIVSVYLTYSRAGIVGMLLAVVLALALARNRTTLVLHGIIGSAGAALVILVLRGHEELAEGAGGEGGPLVATVLLVAACVCALVANATRRAGPRVKRVPGLTRPRVAAACAVAVVAAWLAAGPSVAVRAGGEFVAGGYPAEGDDPAARLASLEGSRAQVWDSALDAFTSHPAGGTGPGTFELWWTRSSSEAEILRDAHSLYLETLAEQGVPGFLLLMLFAAASILAALRARSTMSRTGDRARCGALLVVFLLFLFHAGVDWMWESTALAASAIAAVGIAGAASAPRTRRRVRWQGTSWPLVGVALLACGVQVPGIVAAERGRASAAALERGESDRAADLADDAVRAQPWAASPYAARAIAAAKRGDIAAARIATQEAIEREPTNWRLWRLRAGVLLDAGRQRQSIAALETMVELNPRSAGAAKSLKRAVLEVNPDDS